MKNSTLIMILALSVFSSACKKDNTTPANNTSNTGTSGNNGNNGGGTTDPCPTGKISLTNSSKNPYNVYLNGGKVTTMAGSSKWEKTVDKGNYHLKVEQVSGYAIYPTVQETDLVISGCDTKQYLFP